jgi:hypothetical protein
MPVPLPEVNHGVSGTGTGMGTGKEMNFNQIALSLQLFFNQRDTKIVNI